MNDKAIGGPDEGACGAPAVAIDSPGSFINRELSWLAFARRVLALAEDRETPLLERVKFAGIMGMLYDEFAMKRLGGLRRQIEKRSKRVSADGRTPREELDACRCELRDQAARVARLVEDELRPLLADEGIAIRDHADLPDGEREALRRYFVDAVQPILTPLAADVAHPFPFVSGLGLNLAIVVTDDDRGRERFVRIKVPANRPRWTPVPGGSGFVPLEQVIAANLDLLFPRAARLRCHLFRVTRGAKDDPWRDQLLEMDEAELAPGSLIGVVTEELKARKFAGVVRVQVSADMPKRTRRWLTRQLGADAEDVEPVDGLLALADLMRFHVEGRPELRDAPHRPVTHPRLQRLQGADAESLFAEIRRGDLLLHFPYHSFDRSILSLLSTAAVDPQVLAIKITIYRTGARSPIVAALMEAARRGKQVAVLVEITARFDEAPNIEWARTLERAGAHVAYGVERLKTHVKLALVLREEAGEVRHYVHVGTGNYHTGTARLYEDLGMLSADPTLGAEVGALFNELTGATRPSGYTRLMVAPHDLRERFTALIHREIAHAEAGRSCGIRAKLNQLQDRQMIDELYRAGQAGVPVSLNVRGLCSLRAGVPGLSERIRVYSTLGRFLEHSRIYRFENGGEPEFYIGSADWMRRNLDRRMETIAPVTSPDLRVELDAILRVYEHDNCSAWDMQPDGTYVRRRPAPGEAPRPAQLTFIAQAEAAARRPAEPADAGGGQEA